jgi:hypothetical protein
MEFPSVGLGFMAATKFASVVVVRDNEILEMY